MMSPSRKRVLFVSYAFPPTGGVGVQRVAKFVKHLPAFGWDCSVLTVANPSVPLVDEKLLSDIPPQTVIRAARTWEPNYAVKNLVSAGSEARARSNFLKRWARSAVRAASNLLLQPDPQILWRPAALKAGMRLLREAPHDVIIATGPPFSSLLLGATLARRSGLPLVLDYRDEWGISNAYWENKRQGRVVCKLQSWMQRRAVRAAGLLLATTPSSAASLAQTAREAGAAAKSTFIYNGFDPDDFPTASQSERTDYGFGTSRCRVAFVGTLWNLNPVEPLVAGLKRLASTAPRLLEQLELVFAGRRTAPQETALDELASLPCAVVRLPFIPHAEACRLMQSADGLLLLNADLPETPRVVNAKTFEYMACRRPIITVAPRGDLTELVQDLPGSVWCNPRDPDQIADQIGLFLERHRMGLLDEPGEGDISRFDRRHLAGELAQTLDRLVEPLGSASAPVSQSLSVS